MYPNFSFTFTFLLTPQPPFALSFLRFLIAIFHNSSFFTWLPLSSLFFILIFSFLFVIFRMSFFPYFSHHHFSSLVLMFYSIIFILSLFSSLFPPTYLPLSSIIPLLSFYLSYLLPITSSLLIYHLLLSPISFAFSSLLPFLSCISSLLPFPFSLLVFHLRVFSFPFLSSFSLPIFLLSDFSFIYSFILSVHPFFLFPGTTLCLPISLSHSAKSPSSTSQSPPLFPPTASLQSLHLSLALISFLPSLISTFLLRFPPPSFYSFFSSIVSLLPSFPPRPSYPLSYLHCLIFCFFPLFPFDFFLLFTRYPRIMASGFRFFFTDFLTFFFFISFLCLNFLRHIIKLSHSHSLILVLLSFLFISLSFHIIFSFPSLCCHRLSSFSS